MKDYEKMWNKLKEEVANLRNDKVKEHDEHNHHSEPHQGTVLAYEADSFEVVLDKIKEIEG